MASRASRIPSKRERIPFYRNVKVIGTLLQLLFLAVVLIGIFIVYSNISSALQRSNLPASFRFLGDRAGIPIGESAIRYSTSDTYLRALIVGVLNTLRVALLGIVLASLLGVTVGVMRLSKNWLVSRIAGGYVELLRNTPLAVQLVFWFSAVLVPIPPRITNPIELPGGIMFSQVGLALPWLQPSYNFNRWLPWLLGAMAVFVVFYFFQRRRLEHMDRPGRAWRTPLLLFLLIAGGGYVVASLNSSVPEGTVIDFDPDRGRGDVFIDRDGDGRLGRDETPLVGAEVMVRIDEGIIQTNTSNFIESRQMVYSTFRFPALREHEFTSARLEFANPEDAERFDIHVLTFPTVGVIYEDRNGNGEYDPGEEFVAGDGPVAGFGGVPIVLRVEGFERRVITNRDGRFRLPIFESPAVLEAVAEEAEEQQPAGGGGGLGSLFGPPGGAEDEVSELAAAAELLPSGPLVVSVPSVPRSDYTGGVTLSAPYLALLLGLVIYTASFIAEVVRGGILAVPKGQREAAKAVGLSDSQTFRLIVFPQALRIILPPMISQFLNLTKNSSLAILVTFQDFFAISNIVANQTGATIPVILIVIGGYLIISLTFAFILNIVNDKLALVER